MGAMQNNGKQGKRSGKSTNVSKKLDGLGTPSKVSQLKNWDEALPEDITRVVCAVCRTGGAVMFGRSRDGGALSITVYSDDDRRTLWIGGDDDPAETLLEVAVFFEED